MSMIPNLPEDVCKLAKEYLHTGSSIICNPPVMDTDFDIVMLVDKDNYETSLFTSLGYVLPECAQTQEGIDQYREEMATMQKYAKLDNPNYLHFFTVRKDDINLIVTPCEVLFKRWWNATVWATTLNLQSKKDRRDFFMLVKYGPESAKNGSVL